MCKIKDLFLLLLCVCFCFSSCSEAVAATPTDVTVVSTPIAETTTHPTTAVTTTETTTTTAATTTAATTAQKTTVKRTVQPTTADPDPLSYLGSGAISALLYDVTNETTLYSKQGNKRVYPASITKIITASVALKYVDADTVFTVGSELDLLSWQASVCNIKKGQKATLRALLCGLLIPSGGDAAYTIAVNVARMQSGNSKMSASDALKYFCTLMNSFADEIGMTNSNFSTPVGLHSYSNYTTANDLLKAVRYAMNIKEIANIVCCAVKNVRFESGETYTWRNTNRAIRSDSQYYNKYVTGFKTGSMDVSGYCVTMTVKKDGITYIVIVMGSTTNGGMYNIANRMISYAGTQPKTTTTTPTVLLTKSTTKATTVATKKTTVTTTQQTTKTTTTAPTTQPTVPTTEHTIPASSGSDTTLVPTEPALNSMSTTK